MEMKAFPVTASGTYALLDSIRANIGLSYNESRRLMSQYYGVVVLGRPKLDIAKVGKWIDSNYPGYRRGSLKQFLLDKDPEHLNEWKWLMGIGV